MTSNLSSFLQTIKLVYLSYSNDIQNNQIRWEKYYLKQSHKIISCLTSFSKTMLNAISTKLNSKTCFINSLCCLNYKRQQKPSINFCNNENSLGKTAII